MTRVLGLLTALRLCIIPSRAERICLSRALKNRPPLSFLQAKQECSRCHE